MDKRYWKAICRYGHVGFGNEVSVARYLETDSRLTCFDVWNIVKTMPGVKARGVVFVTEIDRARWLMGKEEERENFYLQQMFARAKKQQLEAEGGLPAGRCAEEGIA